MKKTLALFLALAMLLGAASFASAEGDKLVIQFWHTAASGGLYDVVKNATDAFNATVGAEKGIEVQELYIGSYDDALTKIQLGVTSGEQPVVAVSGLYQIYPQVEDGLLADMATFATADGFDFSNFFDCFQEVYGNRDGTMYSLPYIRSTPLFYYNKTLADSLNLTAPVTIEDMEAFCKALYLPGTSGNVERYGLELAGGSYTYGYPNPAQLGSEFIAADGKSSPTLHDGTMLRIFSDWRRYVDEGWCKPFDAQGGSGILQRFYEGRVAATLWSSGGLASISKAMKEAGYELGVAAYPYYADGKPAVSIGGGSISLIAEGNSDEKQKAGWEFIKFLMTDEQVYRTSIGTGYVPITKSVANYQPMIDFWAENPFAKIAYDQMAVGICQEVNMIPEMTEYMYRGFEAVELLIQSQEVDAQGAIDLLDRTTKEYFD